VRSNCLVFALQRWFSKGGYFIVRKSRWGLFPHFLWSPVAPDECEQFVPINPKRRRFPPLFFRGHIKWGDKCQSD
jgi:hypothetical protein